MASKSDVLAVCKLLNSELNNLPYQLGALERRDPGKKKELKRRLNAITKAIYRVLDDIRLTDNQIRVFTNYLQIFLTARRKLLLS